MSSKAANIVREIVKSTCLLDSPATTRAHA
jgi:hypothetical protein